MVQYHPCLDNKIGRFLMRILITGATGFIGSAIVTELIAQGHEVVCAVRDINFAAERFPETTAITCDFVRDQTQEVWLPRLKNIDVVINAVGVMHHRNPERVWDIHYKTPSALFAACIRSQVKTFIQISAYGIDGVSVAYAASKKAAEEYFQLPAPIRTIILRPSLVYSCSGSYGGTSLFRGLAGLPGVLPVPGRGEQRFQPIHLQDLAKAISQLVTNPPTQSVALAAVGPERISLKQFLLKLRAWLGFGRAIVFPLPLFILELVAKLGNFFTSSTLNKNSIVMLQRENIATDAEAAEFFAAIQFTPRPASRGLVSEPSAVQDRWHARLYWLRPALRYSIAFIWIWSMIASLIFARESHDFLAEIGVTGGWQSTLFYLSCLINGLLGFATLFNYRIALVGTLQCLLILGYTLILSMGIPQLWLSPLGELAKNVTIFFATLVMIALAKDR
jgi:uncharacterized protein YbjT (DUF2867 family)